jgi:hypothetical protein
MKIADALGGMLLGKLGKHFAGTRSGVARLRLRRRVIG